MTNEEIIKRFGLDLSDIDSFAIDTFADDCIDQNLNCKHLIRIWVPDATDRWRENLKAWNLKQREEKHPTPFLDVFADIPMSQEDGFILPKESYLKKKELFTDDLQVTDSHYKGEF